MSRRKKENKRKVRKTKDKQLKQRARHLLGNLTSIEVAGQIFGSIEENDRVTPVDSINADFAKKLTRRLHLDPLLWLLEKGIFSTTLAKNLEQVAAILRAQSPGSTCRRGLNVAVESDGEAQEAREIETEIANAIISQQNGHIYVVCFQTGIVQADLSGPPSESFQNFQ